MEVSEIILWMRNSCNLTRKEMAAITSISDSYYRQLENGVKRPRPKTLLKIANSLHFPMDLYFKDEDKLYLVNAIIALFMMSSNEDLNRLIEDFNLCREILYKEL